MRQEGALSAQLTHIDRLEEECESGDAKVQASFAGIAGLMQLVSEHLERSKSVRDRLQLLMFNSIVEASHLGTQADGILEISTSIKRISAAWGGITTQSEEATGRIGTLVEESHGTVESFSEGSYAGLREARAETHGGAGSSARGGQLRGDPGREVESGGRGAADEDCRNWRDRRTAGARLPAAGKGAGGDGQQCGSGWKRMARAAGVSIERRWSKASSRITRRKWSAPCCGPRSREGRCRRSSRTLPATAWSFSEGSGLRAGTG